MFGAIKIDGVIYRITDIGTSYNGFVQLEHTKGKFIVTNDEELEQKVLNYWYNMLDNNFTEFCALVGTDTIKRFITGLDSVHDWIEHASRDREEYCRILGGKWFQVNVEKIGRNLAGRLDNDYDYAIKVET